MELKQETCKRGCTQHITLFDRLDSRVLYHRRSPLPRGVRFRLVAVDKHSPEYFVVIVDQRDSPMLMLAIASSDFHFPVWHCGPRLHLLWLLTRLPAHRAELAAVRADILSYFEQRRIPRSVFTFTRLTMATWRNQADPQKHLQQAQPQPPRRVSASCQRFQSRRFSVS